MGLSEFSVASSNTYAIEISLMTSYIRRSFLFILFICLIRRADQLIQEENDDVIPYCIAIGDVKKLVSFFTSRGQLKEALLVAQVLHITVLEMYLAICF